MGQSAIRAKKQQKQKLTAAQRKFNATIRKIEKEKALLTEWQSMTEEFQKRRAGTFMPMMVRYNEARAELVRRFDRFFPRKSFSNLQRDKMAHIICESAPELIAEGFNDLRDIHDNYSYHDYDTIVEEEKSEQEAMIRGMFEAEFGVELGEDFEFDMNRPEAIADLLTEKMDEAEQQAETGKKKTAAQKRKEAKQQEEEENISQSIKSVYRQLTKTLHPDRETDAAERERKTELMQKVTKAYRDKDLLKLLELQLEVEQIDQSKIDGIADDKLKRFNKVLERQLGEVMAEVDMVSMAFQQVANMNLGFTEKVLPKDILEKFENDTALLELDTLELEQDLEGLKTVKAIQQWLRDYELPRQNPFDMFDDIFANAPPGAFR